MSAIEDRIEEDADGGVDTGDDGNETVDSNRHRIEILERLSDPRDLLKLINRSARLTDAEIEDRLNTIGWIAANWHQRRAAVTGDINTARACDIYLKRCDEWRARRNSRQPKPTPDADSRPFLRVK